MTTWQRVVLFFLLRLGDLVTTYLAMSKYDGWETIEAVPFNAWLIGELSYVVFALVNLVISAALLFVVLHFNKRYGYLYPLVTGIIGLVVLWNSAIYLFI